MHAARTRVISPTAITATPGVTGPSSALSTGNIRLALPSDTLRSVAERQPESSYQTPTSLSNPRLDSSVDITLLSLRGFWYRGFLTPTCIGEKGGEG